MQKSKPALQAFAKSTDDKRIKSIIFTAHIQLLRKEITTEIVLKAGIAT